MLGRASIRFGSVPSRLSPIPPYRRLYSFTARPRPGNCSINGRSRTSPLIASHLRSQNRQFSSDFSQRLRRLRRIYRDASKDIWRKNPILLPVAILSVIVSFALATYVLGVRLPKVVPDTHYPPKVADALRKALYYTEVNLQPHKALQYYREALALCKVVDMFVNAGLYKPAVNALDRTIQETTKFINGQSELQTKSLKELLTLEDIPVEDRNTLDFQEANKEALEFRMKQRPRLVKKVIGMFLLMGDLLADDHMREFEKAQKVRENAVRMCLVEMKLRRALGQPVVVPPEDDSWMTLEDVGHTITPLAASYTESGRPDLALPLYMQSLAMIREAQSGPSCKQATLLEIIATTIWEHGLYEHTLFKKDLTGQPRLLEPDDPRLKEKSTEEELRNLRNVARSWALKALDVAKHVPADDRSEECDETCAASSRLLASMAAADKNFKEAWKWQAEERRLATVLGAEDLVAAADEHAQMIREMEEEHKAEESAQKP